MDNNNKSAIYDLMVNYLYDCEQNGFSDFKVWCEDNTENDEQEKLANAIADHVNAIAGLLFL